MNRCQRLLEPIAADYWQSPYARSNTCLVEALLRFCLNGGTSFDAKVKWMRKVEQTAESVDG